MLLLGYSKLVAIYQGIIGNLLYCDAHIILMDRAKYLQFGSLRSYKCYHLRRLVKNNFVNESAS